MTQQKATITGISLAEQRRARRIKHELHFRLLDVLHVEQITPHQMRVTLGGEELEGFSSPSFDDHVKVFFPAPGEKTVPRPEVGDKGLAFGEGIPRPTARDFTPHGHDPIAKKIQLDFTLHGQGPAADWARQAKPGDQLGIGGPRGSFVFPTCFDWHLLIGDTTALSAIARRLKELPAASKVMAIIEVDQPEDEVSFETEADVTVQWLHRQTGSQQLLEALASVDFPGGDYFAWIACESSQAKEQRRALIEKHDANHEWVRATGYWRQGAAGVHDKHDDSNGSRDI